MTDKELLNRVANTKWRYAKTYSASAPHEYILKAKEPELYAILATKISTDGVDEPFYRQMYRYLYLGNYKYWAYDNLVNRSRVDGYTEDLKERYLEELDVIGEA